MHGTDKFQAEEKPSCNIFFGDIDLRFCPLWVDICATYFICKVHGLQTFHFICPYDIPPRYSVMATLSYAVEFIVCTAADYHRLTCHTGDLKRQHLSLCCILLVQ